MTFPCSITQLPQTGILDSIENLRGIVDKGHSVSFELFRTVNLSTRSAKAYLAGLDPNLMKPLAKISISKAGYLIYWLSSTAKPPSWLGHSKIFCDKEFDNGLKEIDSTETALSIGNLQIS